MGDIYKESNALQKPFVTYLNAPLQSHGKYFGFFEWILKWMRLNIITTHFITYLCTKKKVRTFELFEKLPAFWELVPFRSIVPCYSFVPSLSEWKHLYLNQKERAHVLQSGVRVCVHSVVNVALVWQEDLFLVFVWVWVVSLHCEFTGDTIQNNNGPCFRMQQIILHNFPKLNSFLFLII